MKQSEFGWSALIIYVFLFSPIVWAENCRSSVTSDTKNRSIVSRSTKLSNSLATHVELPYSAGYLSGRGAYVEEGHFVAFDSIQSKNFDILYTGGLLSCVALVVQDRESGVTLLSHFSTHQQRYQQFNKVKKYINVLEERMNTLGSSLERSEITLVWGADSRLGYGRRVEKLVTALHSYTPKALRIDSVILPVSESLVGIDLYVDLKDGQLYKSIPSVQAMESISSDSKLDAGIRQIENR